MFLFSQAAILNIPLYYIPFLEVLFSPFCSLFLQTSRYKSSTDIWWKTCKKVCTKHKHESNIRSASSGLRQTPIPQQGPASSSFVLVWVKVT